MTQTAGVAPSDAQITFDAMAPYYDAFIAHYDYELWLGNVLPALERHGLSGRRLLDVGCGTGKSFLPMLERGWEVTACDISAAMLEIARDKAGGAARLELADMRALPRFGEFDLVWAIDDALNYLLSRDELVLALAGMRANLAPGGRLFFDLNTLHMYRTFYVDTTVSDSLDGQRIVWRGKSSADVGPGSICESVVGVEGADGRTGTPSVHRERHFPAAEVVAAMDSVGLETLAVLGHGDDAVLEQPVDEERHTKMVFIATQAPDSQRR